MFEFEVRFSKTTRDANRIGCEMFVGAIYADSEAEAREIFAQNEPGMTLDSIVLVPDE